MNKTFCQFSMLLFFGKQSELFFGTALQITKLRKVDIFFGNNRKKTITEKVLSFVPLIAVSLFGARKDGIVLFYKL